MKSLLIILLFTMQSYAKDSCEVFENQEQTHADYPGIDAKTKYPVTCSLDINNSKIVIVVYGWNMEKRIEFQKTGAFVYQNKDDRLTITSKAILLKTGGNLYEFDRTRYIVDWREGVD